MKITLTNFGCWTDRTFEFPDSGNVLLMAPSGTGKTTLIRAIMFALFGKGNKLQTHGKTSCKVLLEFEELKIERSKGPCKLVVNDVFEDAHAQSIIDARFPNGAAFYLDQLDKKCFLTMSNNDKLAILDKIAMRNVPIKEMVKSIKEDAKESQDIGLKKQGEAEYIKRTLEDIGDIPEIGDSVVTQEQIGTERVALIEMVSKKTAYNQYIQSQDKISMLRNQIHQTRESMPTTSPIQNQRDTLKQLKESKAYYKKHNLYVLYSSQLQKTVSNERDDVSTAIETTSEKLKLASQNRPDEKSITSLEKYLPKLKFKEELLKDLKDIGDVLTGDEIQEIETELQSRLDACNSMKCPSCQTNLIKNGKELVVCHADPVPDTTIQEIREKLSNERSRLSRHRELTERIAKYNPDHVYEDLLKKFQDMKDRVAVCKELEDTLRQLNNRKWAQDKIDTANKDLQNRVKEYESYKEPLSQTEFQIDSKIEELQRLISQHEQVEDERNRCLRRIDDMNDTIQKLEAPEPPRVSEKEVETQRALIERMNQQLLTQERIKDIREKQKHLEVAELEASEAFNRLKSLNKLKDLVYEAQSEVIQATLQTINANAVQYIEDFFPDNEMVSELTMDASKKNKITNTIFFKGHSVDFSTLSGGERDRLTLAYALAISDLSNDRLFIMDECVSSLDMDNACNVFNSIQSGSNSLNIVVAHQIVMGIFDSIIKL